MTKPKPKRYERYSAAFKRAALRRAADAGVTDRAVCEELGIGTRQVRRWHGEMAMLGQDSFPGNGRPRDQEVAGLKPALARVNKERGVLKEAAGYFAKLSKRPTPALIAAHPLSGAHDVPPSVCFGQRLLRLANAS